MATITGGAGDDTQSGTSSADTIYGGAGNDSANAGQGNDIFYGGTGNDTVYGGNGDDSLTGEAGNDYLDGGAGKDNLTGGQGYDTIYGGSDDDMILGDGQLYTLTASSGTTATNLTITNSADGPVELWWVNTSGVLVYNTTLAAGQTVVQPTSVGHHWMLKDTQGYYLEQVTAGTNSSVNYGLQTADSLFGGDGKDTIYAQYGNDTVYGGLGDDRVDLGSGDDRFGNFNDEGGKDTIYGGAGNDYIIAGSDDDKVYGGDGNDSMSGGSGSDSLYGGAGRDQFYVTDDHDKDYIEGGADWDIVYYSNYSSSLGVNVTFTGNDAGKYDFAGTKGEGNFIEIEGIGGTEYADTVNAAADSNGVYVEGRGSNDSLTGGSGNDWLDGGANEDTLTGGDGADQLFAGTGNDVLYGGADNDTFWINANEGTDAIYGGATGADQDVLSLGGGALTPVTLTINGAESGSYSYAGGGSGSFQNIENFWLTAGNDTVNGAANTSAMTIDANEGNDVVTTGAGNDYIDGDRGDDRITSGAGSDTLVGGAGNDTLAGGAGGDALYGGTGLDIADYSASNAAVSVNLLYGTASGGDAAGDSFASVEGLIGSAYNDTLIGANGQSSLSDDTYSSFIDGGAGNDSIDGRAGDDTLFGGTGDDWLSGGTGNDTLDGGGGRDTAVFTGAVTEYSFDYTPSGGLIVIDSVVGRDGVDMIRDVEYVQFNGVTYHLVTGDDGSNTTLQGPGDGTPSIIIAHDGNDWGGGHATSDVIFGGAGEDTLDGGDGQDTLLGEDGNDLLRGDGGNDVIYGGSGADTLQGGAGTDALFGGDGNDQLTGGAGNDSLTGGLGADEFALTQGGGDDRVTDFDMTLHDGHTWDQLDVSDLRDLSGGAIRWRDVVVTDTVGDGSGDAILTFPGGETITLQGVSPSAVDSKQEMAAIGIPCFTAGTPIRTPQGWTPVEDLRAGDWVLTETGPAPVIWSGHRALNATDLARHPDWKPVHFPIAALGNTVPLRLSAQHAVLMRDGMGRKILVRAKHLAEIGFGKARVAHGIRQVCYHHLLLARHAVLCAAGAPAESFYPGAQAMAMLDWPARLAVAAAITRAASPAPRATALPLATVYGARAYPLLTGKMLTTLFAVAFPPLVISPQDADLRGVA